MLSPAQIRERLRAAAHGVFSMDDGMTAEAAEWLAGLSARDLLRVDGFARQWRLDGPTLGKAQQWTKEVLQYSETAAAIGAMHADGFVRERSLRRLAAGHSSIAMRMIAVRALDHVQQVRAVAQVELAQRTALQQAAEIMPILERSDARSLGSRVRASYLDSICAIHGEETVWEALRRSTDRDMRRAAYRHSALSGYIGHEEAVHALPRERDQDVRRVLARLIADSGDVEAIRRVLLHARAADARVLALVRLSADQLPDADVERLLIDSSVFVRWWARKRWAELGHDARAACRQAIAEATSPTVQARAYIGLAEAGESIDREELVGLVDSDEPALRKVGLKLIADKVRSEDKQMLLDLVADDHSRVARLASEALAANLGIWALEDVQPLKQSGDPIMRRRAWWLHRHRGGWEAVIADLQALHDPDDSIVKLGRSPRPPMYVAPSAEQQSQVQALLVDAPLSREQKLNIALAAGLRELLTELREQPRFQPRVQLAAADEVGVPQPATPVRSWWRRWASRS